MGRSLSRRLMRLRRRKPACILLNISDAFENRIEKFPMIWIYVLWSSKIRKRYVGFCEDLEKRFQQHNAGRTPFTKRGFPWILIHSEQYDNPEAARHREVFLKTGVGRKWLDENFPNYRRGARAVE